MNTTPPPPTREYSVTTPNHHLKCISILGKTDQQLFCLCNR